MNDLVRVAAIRTHEVEALLRAPGPTGRRSRVHQPGDGRCGRSSSARPDAIAGALGATEGTTSVAIKPLGPTALDDVSLHSAQQGLSPWSELSVTRGAGPVQRCPFMGLAARGSWSMNSVGQISVSGSRTHAQATQWAAVSWTASSIGRLAWFVAVGIHDPGSSYTVFLPGDPDGPGGR